LNGRLSLLDGCGSSAACLDIALPRLAFTARRPLFWKKEENREEGLLATFADRRNANVVAYYPLLFLPDACMPLPTYLRNPLPSLFTTTLPSLFGVPNALPPA
jgi:hypothetical protein